MTFEVEAAFAVLGLTRAALLLYIGQPDSVGARLYDSGGLPLPRIQVHSVASINGESAWAGTTSRRLTVDVDPHRPVTWQLLVGIIGGGDSVAIPGARQVAITPDGTRGFVTSPATGTVTPVVLGRPGYTTRRDVEPLDRVLPAVATGAGAHHLAVDDAHVVVSNADDPEHHVTVLSASSGEIVAQHRIDGGAARGAAIVPDGSAAIVVTAAGRVARVLLAEPGTQVVALGGHPALAGVTVSLDGRHAFVGDTSTSSVHRLALPALAPDASAPVGAPPVVLRTAPDGRIWALCRPASPAPGRLIAIDAATGDVVADHELPYPAPVDVAIVPVAGQTSLTVRTAWVVFDGGRYCQFNIGPEFTGQPHSIHCSSFGDQPDGATGVAVSDFGEIWVARAGDDSLWRWLGGRVHVRPGLFYGEYCSVAVHGARSSLDNDPARAV